MAPTGGPWRWLQLSAGVTGVYGVGVTSFFAPARRVPISLLCGGIPQERLRHSAESRTEDTDALYAHLLHHALDLFEAEAGAMARSRRGAVMRGSPQACHSVAVRFPMFGLRR